MKNQRVRRAKEDARAEILDAAQAALEERGFGELTVETVMKRTGMSRPSFYHYFAGLDELAIGLLEELERDIRASVDVWLRGDGGDDPKSATVQHLTDMYAVMDTHRIPVRALAQGAGGLPLVYQRWQARVVEYFIELTADFIQRQVDLRRSRVADPLRLARALILMNNAVANDAMLREEPGDLPGMAGVIAAVWNRAIFDDESA